MVNGATPRFMYAPIRRNAALFAKNNLKKKRRTLP
nr:MAG TPA: hypothetical protein [Caudoviricetes sp.]